MHRLVLDLSTLEGCKAELTGAMNCKTLSYLSEHIQKICKVVHKSMIVVVVVVVMACISSQ